MFASSEEVQELLTGLASILWGLLAVIGLFVFAFREGSLLGVGLAVLTAGLTYLFQELQRHHDNATVRMLGVVPVFMWFAAFLCTVVGA
jgi:hypothetical protein